MNDRVASKKLHLPSQDGSGLNASWQESWEPFPEMSTVSSHLDHGFVKSLCNKSMDTVSKPSLVLQLEEQVVVQDQRVEPLLGSHDVQPWLESRSKNLRHALDCASRLLRELPQPMPQHVLRCCEDTPLFF
jgi:hypothetical protein